MITVVYIFFIYIIGIIPAFIFIAWVNSKPSTEADIPKSAAFFSWLFFLVLIFGGFFFFLDVVVGRYIDRFYDYLEDKFRQK